MYKILFQFAALTLMILACNSKTERVLRYSELSGQKIPELDLSKIDDEVSEIPLSDIISDYYMVPLETTGECLIGPFIQQLEFSPEGIIVSTQIFPEPAPVYLFSDKGKFIRSIGKGGKGPGEHSSVYVAGLDWNEGLVVSFDQPQLFDRDYNYAGDIKQPYSHMGPVYRYSEDLFFSPGEITGHRRFGKDSVMLVFHNMNGNIISYIPRQKYPPGVNDYTPETKRKAVYRYNNSWKMQIPGCDTVYIVGDKTLHPSMIVKAGDKGFQYNEFADQSIQVGRYEALLVAETSKYWLFRNFVLTRSDLKESRPGSWTGMTAWDFEYIFVDKEDGNSRRFRLVDDIWQLCDIMRLTKDALFIDNERLVFYLQAPDIKVKIAEKLETPDIALDLKNRLEELDKQITEDSNPVIFVFNLKEKI